jgi:peptidoglycan/LPS O-acetylase OafA/YrhL
VFRIVPLYLLVSALYFIGAELTNEDPGIERGWITLLFLTGWFILIDGREAVPFTITWSLSVEEFAYLICGFTFLLLKRQTVTALLGLVILSAIIRSWLLIEEHPFNVVYYFPPARLDSVFLGSLTAIAVTRGNHKIVLILGTIALAGAILASYLSTPAFQIVLFPAIAVGVCLSITLIEVYAKEFTSLPTRWIGRFGFYAYFIYLFHYFIIYGLQVILKRLSIDLEPLELTLFTFAIVMPCAVFSWRYFESPLIGYGRFLEKKIHKSSA